MELKKYGALHQYVIQKENEYYGTVDELKNTGKYPSGEAEEVYRMFPKLDPR